MKKILIILSITLTAPLTAVSQWCSVGTNVAGRTNRGLYSVKVVEKGSIRSATGIVLGGDDRPVSQAKIEIFNRPGWIKSNRRTPPDNQRRLLACQTTKEGKFSVLGLPKGVYELRISFGIPYSVTHVYLAIDPTAAKKRQLRVYLHLGD